MNTCALWKYGIAFMLTCALFGCDDYDDDSYRDTVTDVACFSDSVCDQDGLTCTSTFDETFTEFVDKYDDDSERHTTTTEDTHVTRVDDIDPMFTVLASLQTETFITTTTKEKIHYDDDDDDENITVTTTTTGERVVTTWTQDCPTCPVEMCTSSNNDPFNTCSLIAAFPPFPQCED